MKTLPGAEDVGKINISRDPGVQAPGRDSSGMRELGAAISQVGAQFQAANDARVLSNLEAETALSLTNFQAGLDEDPDSFEEWEHQFDEFTKDQKKEIQGRGLNKNVYGAWERTAAPIAARARLKVMAKARATMVNKGLADLKSNLKAVQGLAITGTRNDRDAIYLPQAQLMIERAQNTGIILDTTAQKLNADFMAGTEKARFANAINIDPELALEGLDAGDFEVSEADKPAWRKTAEAAARPVRLKRESKFMAGKIMGEEDDPAKQLEEARKINDPDVSDAAVQRIKIRQNEAKELEKAKALQEASDLTDQAMDIYLAKGSKEDFMDIAVKASSGKTKKDLVNLGNSLYSPSKQTTDYGKLAEATDEVDEAVSQGRKMSDQYLLLKYKPHMKDAEYKQLLKYKSSAFDKKEKHDVSSAKTRIKQYYDRQDFGPTTGGDSQNSKRIKADLLLGLNSWVDNNPNKDPQEYVDSKVELVAAEEEAKGLNTFWEAFVPGQQKDQRMKAIALGEMDDEILDEMIRAGGYDPASYSDKTKKAMKNTSLFAEEKTKQLSQ